ncbi:MAG TPA: hypothetical protein VFY80_04955, partial [Burkholderiales bacterium]|nr:hypothetical protein [Burkholderiales bacterium]
MPAAISRYSDHTARWSAIALGFSIPLTVALNNVFLASTLLAWLLGGGYREKLAAFRHPAAIPAIALFALTALGILYSQADLDAAVLHLKKYIDLMLIPVFLYVFRDA